MSSDEGCGVTIGLQGFGDLLLFSRSFTGIRGQGGCSIHECSHNRYFVSSGVVGLEVKVLVGTGWFSVH